ncbi:MAG: hypothetical protein M1825_000241 [Sarcosagium campestre]|nr:MAG: hypothetical protein M1825_000241 [Sarcosagium campestre]
MSKTVHINSAAQFSSLLSSSKIVVTDFYADWCGPCKVIAPVYEQLSSSLSRPGKITFAKVNTDEQQDVARIYKITAMPTFMIFRDGKVESKILGADGGKLSEAVQKLAAEAESSGGDAKRVKSSSAGAGTTSGDTWLGAALPRAFSDVSDQIDTKGLDMLNSDPDFGTVRGLFQPAEPTGFLPQDKRKEVTAALDPADPESRPDWVESDTDEQLMVYVPFQCRLKAHSLQITSLQLDDDDEEKKSLRPRTIHIYTNQSHILGFDEAAEHDPTQTIELSPKDWDKKTHTAKVELQFVRYQNVSSLVLFFVDVENEGERVRIDRIRVIGEAGDKLRPGKLEKISHDH